MGEGLSFHRRASVDDFVISNSLSTTRPLRRFAIDQTPGSRGCRRRLRLRRRSDLNRHAYATRGGHGAGDHLAVGVENRGLNATAGNEIAGDGASACRDIARIAVEIELDFVADGGALCMIFIGGTDLMFVFTLLKTGSDLALDAIGDWR
jgi:hypothetical protein